MTGTTSPRTWIAPIAWSVGLLAVVLVGSIVSVKMLSDRDAITLAGGIAVFAVAISAWFVVTTALVVHRLRGRGGPVERPADRLREIERPPLVNR
jgi:uncharacterized membrane protein YhaH (DUF805 family)